MTETAIGTFEVLGPLPRERTTTMLEASAGTGKTWTIAALVARLVTEGEAPLEQMLVVTFGRAASQELRERVRERLVGLERAFAAAGRGESPAADDIATFLLDVDADEREVRHRRLREALTGFDEATIVTTHQFCHQVLRGLGVAGDTDPGVTLVEDLDDLLIEVVDDLYLRGFAHSTGSLGRDEALTIARQALADPIARLEPSADARPDAALRVRFAHGVRKEMTRRKRALGVLSYDDLLSQVVDALEQPDSAAPARMRQRWSVVLVDEFQDTDPVQWRVLDLAFSGHARMVLIGDPKQAIYAFRGGDVVTYLAARAKADVVATLGTNYRSDPALLEHLQALLRGAQLGDEQILVRDVEAGLTGSRLVGAPHTAPFRLRLLERAAFGRSDPTAPRLRAHVAWDVACDIRALLDSGATFDARPLRASDVAVICQTHRQAAFVAQALTDVGVPLVMASGASVFSSEGARQWLTLLQALERPQQVGRVRTAALTAFFGHTALDLHHRGEELTDAVSHTLRDWAELLRRRGVAAVYEAATGVSERVLSTVGGERLLTDLRHVAEVLHDHMRATGIGLVALVGWVREQIVDQRATPTARTRRLDSDESAVQVLTVHGSKGLEFGVVYAPFLADTFIGETLFGKFHDDDGNRCVDVGGPQSDMSFATRAEQELSGERLRLLYVALTRAQAQLVVWWLPSRSHTPASPLHRLIFGRRPGEGPVPDRVAVRGDQQTLAHAQMWDEAGAFHLERAAPQEVVLGGVGSADDAMGSEMLVVSSFDRAIDHDWRRTSYSALTAAAEAVLAHDGPEPLLATEPEDAPRADEQELAAPPAPELPGDRPSPMADLPAGATFGSLVHQALELADPAAPGHDGDLRAELREAVGHALVRWPVTLDVDVLTDALVAVCTTPLGPLVGDGVTLADIGLADRLRELDFELPLHGGADAARVDDAVGPDPTLADLAPILRRHLGPEDPLATYADVVIDPAYAAQRLRGYLTGSVDLVMRRGGRYLVADYKTNWLGEPEEPLRASNYAPSRLSEAMAHSSYPLQALLYAVVLHRFLRWRLPGYEPEQHLGGVLYLYVRGMCGPDTPVVDGQVCGVFSWSPPPHLVVEVSDLLDGWRP